MEIPAFYERQGLNVVTYDERTALEARGALSGDIEFYFGLAQRTGGPILDLGGGTGRVAWPFADAGYDVWSLDLSEEMQTAGRLKASRPERARVRHPVTRNEVRVNVAERHNDPLRQVMEERWEFEEVDGAGAIVRHETERLAMRWTYRYEMRYLLELAGFTVEGEYSDFKGSPAEYGREQVWVATR